MMAEFTSLAGYLIYLRDQESFYYSLSPMKLQKLMYYCHGMHYKRLNRQLIDTGNMFKAWDYGPVIPDIYQQYKVYGSNDIPVDCVSVTDIELTAEEKNIIEEVWNKLKHYSAYDLANATHKEPPWRVTYNNGAGRGADITEEQIISFFTRRA